jgi:hypothetical protein
VALSFNLSFTFFSGLAPVVATLLARNSGVPATAAYYMIGCALVTFIAALVMHKYDGQILADLGESPRTGTWDALETPARPRETAGEGT